MMKVLIDFHKYPLLPHVNGTQNPVPLFRLSDSSLHQVIVLLEASDLALK